ncbi:RNA methyltransferase [Pseudanabaena sp. FACHB-2040]|uniref:RNA methyltransferase n=1 Tax=Pseudanabaena sp. FACHB-2040 TaxID=2692859 RepID=UPI0016866EB9|nr:RNA methyltransferase [Pseudanabaena sp. FACHB-2040]MBD2258480.1 RNA methyltransferase [Pseudanabaena sp. FACHB-2040]
MAESVLAQVRIVLVEPAGPLNIGSVARIMKNMGLQQLVLVKPSCDPLSELARQMAVHGADVLETASVVETLPQALVGCQRAIATTARPRAGGETLELPEAVLPWLLPNDPPADFQAALIFGPEDRGLSNAELNHAQRFLRIPSSDTYPALNLAQAVAVCCYLLRRAALGEVEVAPASPALVSAPLEEAASLDQIEGFYQQLEGLLLQVGYLFPHTATSRMEKFRRLLHRAAPTQQELAMLRGILSQVDWALASNQRQQ